MRGLTLWRPWSDAIVHGPKRVENRPWAPPAAMLGELIAIHSGKVYDFEMCVPIGVAFTPPRERDCPTGIVGVARIGGYLDLRKGTSKALDRFGCMVEGALLDLDSDPWWGGPVGWLLGDVQALPEPIPHPGSLGLWRVPPEKAAQVEAQLGVELPPELPR